MKTVKLSDFSPYDRNKGGIQELHHKIESKILQVTRISVPRYFENRIYI